MSIIRARAPRIFRARNVYMLSRAQVSGATGAMVGSPFFMIKCRIQAQSKFSDVGGKGAGARRYYGVWDGLRQVFREEGVAGLFRGVDGAVPRVMVGSATQLASYDSIKSHLVEWGYFKEGFSLHLASSLLTGLIVTTAMNPFDVVSTRLYNQPQCQARIYSGPVDCFVKTFKAEGFGGFYKGWLAHYARLGPHTVLTLVFWEQCKLIAKNMSA
mmetsp:Transcript_70256/g.187202  ORF Transcript_70256/g.187202 Transcript_70256/m.187202 type:complete len:214 (-) Transcript_70256:172-813(-)